VSEQDKHLEPEEDVEGHANKGSHVNRNIAKDDDDVEGHQHLNQQKGQQKGHEDDDDVEGHMHLNQHKGQHKA
jgi:hypothetical protein